MGLFDKVKSMANAVTGGAAKVYVDVGSITYGEPFQVTVRAQSQGSEVKYDRVYLKVQGIERVEVPDFDVEYEANGERHRRREIVRKSTQTVNLELTVAPAGVLGENESGEWTIEVELPSGAVPNFKGRYCEHYYQVFAGLDCFGNDPDSGWIRIAMV